MLQSNEILVSEDVKSLFTSIPVQESLEICERKLKADETLSERSGGMDVDTIIRLLKFCLTTTAFQYRGTHYEQLDGVAMGSPVSPVIADIFMEDLEDKIFEMKISPDFGLPRLWSRFVDDVIAVIRKIDGQALLNHLNRQHPRFQFTMEEEEGGSLPFMDVRFTRREDGTLIRQIYQKPTHTKRYIQFDSHHPASVKSGVIQGLTDRAMKVCSGIVERNQELQRIENVMVENGYPRKFTQKAISRQLKRGAVNAKRADSKDKGTTFEEPEASVPKIQTVRIPFVDGLSQEVRRLARKADVRCAFYQPDTLRHLYQAKDRLPTETKTHAVYSVKCKTCDMEYVGETQRALKVRKKNTKTPFVLDKLKSQRWRNMYTVRNRRMI